MSRFTDSVSGQHGEWAVGDAIGETPRWQTYHGTSPTGDPVALRTLVGKIPESRLDRFNSLARQWAAVNEYRSVRSLLDWGTEPQPWVAVECVSDELDAWAGGSSLEAATACDLQTRAELLFAICEVLQTYSRYGSTPCHLALHPDCLSFRADSDGAVPVVDDWGLSRLVTDPPLTPYTAPEQIEDDHAAKRTDVYRVGALAAAVLGERPPLPNVDPDNLDALRAAIRDGIDIDGLADALPEGTAQPLGRATARTPSDRYATSSPLGRALLDAVPSVAADERETDTLVVSTDTTSDTTDSDSDSTATDQPPETPSDADDDAATAADTESRSISGRRAVLGVLGVGAVGGGGWYLLQQSPSERTDTGAPAGTEATPEPQWTVDVADSIHTLVLDSDMLYLGCETSVAAVSVSDREEQWQFSVAAEEGSEVDALSVGGDNVYLGHRLDAYVLSAADGSERRRFGVGTAVTDPPAVTDSTVYWKSGGSVHARSVADGTEQWTSQSGHEFGGAPVVADDTVYDTGYALGNDGDPYGTMYVLSTSDGNSQWRFQATDFITAPAVVGETAYVGSSDRTLYALSTRDGTLQWSNQTRFEIAAPPIVSDQTVYVRSENQGIQAISATDGTEQWQFEPDASLVSPLAVAGNTIYVTGYQRLYALSSEDGTLRWSYTPEGAAPSPGSPLIADEMVYIGDSEGRVHAIPTTYSGSDSWPLYQGDQQNRGHLS